MCYPINEYSNTEMPKQRADIFFSGETKQSCEIIGYDNLKFESNIYAFMNK